MPGRDARDVLFTGVVVASLVVTSALAGVLCAFLVPLRLPGGIEGLADLLALISATGLGVLGAWGTGSMGAAVAPGVVMLLVTVLAGQRTPGGGLVVPGSIESDAGVGTVGLLLLGADVVGVLLALIAANALYSRRRSAEDKERDGAR